MMGMRPYVPPWFICMHGVVGEHTRRQVTRTPLATDGGDLPIHSSCCDHVESINYPATAIN